MAGDLVSLKEKKLRLKSCKKKNCLVQRFLEVCDILEKEKNKERERLMID